MSWWDCELGDVLTLKRGHDLPEKTRISGSIPVVSSSGISGYHNESKADAPGVVTGRYGTLGEVYFIEQAFWPLNTALYVVDFKGNNPRFISYFLKNTLQNYRSDKAAVPGVDRKVLHRLKVRVPDQNLQIRITSILSAYDDLITNNRRRIALLQRAAGELYREWFVRFRFPGHEYTKITNDVPHGWEEKQLGEIAEVQKGKNITKDSAHRGSVPVVAGGLTPAYFHNTANAVGPVITISASGANAGYVNLYHEDIWASDCSYISIASADNLFYLYLLLKSKQRQIFALQRGAAQPHVYPRDLKTLSILAPNDELLNSFQQLIEEYFDQIRVLSEQDKLLIRARDLLLPRLMKGEMTG